MRCYCPHTDSEEQEDEQTAEAKKSKKKARHGARMLKSMVLRYVRTDELEKPRLQASAQVLPRNSRADIETFEADLEICARMQPEMLVAKSRLVALTLVEMGENDQLKSIIKLHTDRKAVAPSITSLAAKKETREKAMGKAPPCALSKALIPITELSGCAQGFCLVNPKEADAPKNETTSNRRPINNLIPSVKAAMPELARVAQTRKEHATGLETAEHIRGKGRGKGTRSKEVVIPRDGVDHSDSRACHSHGGGLGGAGCDRRPAGLQPIGTSGHRLHNLYC